MRRIRICRFWNNVSRVMNGILLLQLALAALKLWYHPLSLAATCLVGLFAAACYLFSIACPFCNRPLPGKAFKQPGKHTCEFCGKEIDIV